MSIEIKNRWTGAVIRTIDADTLSGANLSGANLSEANLSEANLSGANLSEANLRRADLCGANLYRADLCGANLYEANLSGANLCGANLRRADLCGANLYGANLYEANLRRADLCGANLSGANLCGANLYGAKRYIDGDTAITLHGPRPILTLGPLGSRDDNMMAPLTSAGLRIECGCFRGTLDEFKAAVEKTHADNPRHLAEYLAAIRMIKAWAKVEMKLADQWERDNPVEARHD